MAAKQCSKCLESKPLSDFHNSKFHKDGKDTVCKVCKNARQRERRKLRNNASSKKYEKTKKGFLMRLYRNMESRINGVQKEKFYLYRGKRLRIEREEFYQWALSSPRFHRLFEHWREQGFDRKLTPSIDRVDSGRGYAWDNIEWVTHSENSRRGAKSRWN